MSDSSDRTGEAGVGFLELKTPKLLGYIFRRAAPPDYGIDGEIEVTDQAGSAAGRLIAAQVKSGPSYLDEQTDDVFIYRGSRRHLDYWRNHSLPVVIILVDVEKEIAYWAEIDDSVVVTGEGWKIAVPKAQQFDASAKPKLRDLANKLADEVAARARKDYESIREQYFEGARRAAFTDLQQLVKQPSWRFAGRPLHAEAFRTLALWSFILTRELETAEEFLRKAKDADANSDESVVHAMIAAITDGPAAGIPFVTPPQSAPAANTRVLLLANSGKLDEAKAELDNRPENLQRNTETTRIEALVALLDRDMAQARERITVARAEKPRWVSIRETYGLIEYFAVLPPSEWPDAVEAFPSPLPAILLRQDDESLRHIRTASAIFRDLADTAEDKEDRDRYMVWHLAALANDPEAQQAARSLVEQRLGESELYPPLVAWAFHRGLAPADMLLDRLLTEVDGISDPAVAEENPALVLTALQLLTARERHSDARALLDRFHVPLRIKNKDVVHYWYARILSATGDRAAATAEVEQIAHDGMRAEARAVAGIEAQDGTADWRETAAARHALYQKSGDVAALIEAVRMHGQHEDWDFVLASADELFQHVPNIATLEAICEAAWRKGRYRECLTWLDRWRATSALHTEALQQTRLACLVRVDPLRAVAAARDLLREYPTAANTVRAIIAFVRIGDLKSASVEARRLLTAPDADSETLLNAAQVTAVEDPELALTFWRAAMAKPIGDDSVGAALSLAHQLGQDEETGPLIVRMQQLAAEDRGGVKALSFPEVIDFANAHQERVAEVLGRFYAAELPVHTAARTLGWTLAEVFRVWPADNRREASVIRHRPLLTRFGGLPSDRPGVNARALWMDISAFFLAADLDLLDAIEKTYAPIHVSRFLPAAVFEQERRLGDSQPSQIEMYGRILALVDAKRIHVLQNSGTPRPDAVSTGDRGLDLFLAACAAEDYSYVEQLPITDHDLQPIPLAPEVGARIWNLADFLEAAHRDAVIDDEAYRRATVGQRPPTGDVGSRALPPKVALSALATTTLAGGDALEQLAAAVETFVPHWVIDEARATIAWSTRRRDVAGWLERLRERLRQGLEKGVYVTTGAADLDVDDPRDLDYEALRDLLQEVDAASGALWVEDRMCSRVVGTVIGVADVLNDLRERGALQEGAHSALLHRLRAEDLRYLDVERDDLVRLLTAARARPMPDTKELETLARYVAAIALDGNRRNGRANAPAEIAVIVEASRVTTTVVPEIWKLHLPSEDRAIQHAGWFMANVYVGHLAIRASSEREATDAMAKSDLAFDLAQLYLGAILVAIREQPAQWENSFTAAYVHWVSTAFANHHFFTEPDLLELTGQKLASLAATYTAGFAAQKQLAGFDAFVAAVFLLLPDKLHQAWLKADPDFGTRHGLRIGEQVTISGASVPPRHFWAALERAVAGKRQPRRAEVRVTIESTPNGDVIAVEHGGATRRIDDPLFVQFARGNADACATWSEQHPEFFDMSREDRRAAGHRLGQLGTAHDRVMAANPVRDESGRSFYARLRQQLDTGGRLPETAFTLSASTVANHLRWRTDADAAARDLLADVGVEEALRRLISLPMRLAQCMVDALTTEADVVGIVRRLAATAVGPLSVMHCAALALRLSTTHPELQDLGRSLIGEVLGPAFAEGAYATFDRAYTVVNAWMSYDASAASYTPETQLLLAMSHAGRLLDTMGKARLAKARAFFTGLPAVSRDFLSRDPEFYEHRLHPTNLTITSFIVALCSLLADVPAESRDAAEVPAKLRAALERMQAAKQIGGFFIDTSRMHAETPTVFDGEVPDAVLSISGAAPFTLPTTSELKETMSTLLQNARTDIMAGSWWIPFGAVVQHHRVRPEDEPRIRDLVAAFSDNATRWRLTDRDAVMCASVLGGQVSALQDPTLREQFLHAYMDLAREFSGGTRDTTLLNEIGPAFLDVAFAVSARVNDPAASAQALATHVDDLVRAWPAVAYAIATRLSAFVWTVPAHQAHALWRVFLRARENSFDA